MEKEFLDSRIKIKIGDITLENVDAIVNAANSTLLGGGGVDGAIHDAGGKQILEECLEIRRIKYPNGLPTGKAVITSGGKLRARFVIHTVGPIFGNNDGNDVELLASCYENSLALAVENDLSTIAFPAISTGVFGYPKHEATEVSSAAIKDFLAKNDSLQEIRLVFFSAIDAQNFIKYQKF